MGRLPTCTPVDLSSLGGRHSSQMQVSIPPRKVQIGSQCRAGEKQGGSSKQIVSVAGKNVPQIPYLGLARSEQQANTVSLEYSSNGVSLLFPVTSNCIQQGTPNTLGWPTASYTHSRAFQWPLPCILFALFPPASTPASSAIWPSAIVLSSAPSHPAGSRSILCFWMTSHFSLWLIFLQFFCSCLIHPLIFFLFFYLFGLCHSTKMKEP